MQKYKVTDDRGNTVQVTAASRGQAREVVQRMLPGLRRLKVEDEGPAPVQSYGLYDKPRPLAPVLRKEKQKPNELCRCKSGLKFKRCCGR